MSAGDAILHPFGDDPDEARQQRRQALLERTEESRGAEGGELTSRELKDHSNFRKSAELALRPHWSVADLLRQRFFSPILPPEIQEGIAPTADRLNQALDRLQKSFRIYVETAASESLEREAERLERRYFRDLGQRNQIEYVKLRRYYEKIRTFNETAKREWREIQKVLDTLLVLKDTRSMAAELEREFVRGVHKLVRQTESFLDDLKLYLEVSSESIDRITGSAKIACEFNPEKRYTIAALLGDAPGETEQVAQQPAAVEEQRNVNASESSIAQFIVLETREHKLNRASIIATPLLGSRDWNRSPDYILEIPIRYFDECVTQFRSAYHVNMSPDKLLHMPLPTAAAIVRKGVGEMMLGEYHEMIVDIINNAAIMCLVDDFPGVDRPDVFLYHCGPRVLDRILVAELKQSGLGEIFYLDDNNNSIREYPQELLQKILIDWWNDRFRKLSGEEVDSYLSYSRQLEMVRREYRALHEEGVALRKKEQPGSSYLGVEKWLRENRTRVFGLRKLEIFRRFVTASVLES
ncbi:MAG: hypothetical protein K1X75_17660 [Leptospirales bacterium]|nr:hypothetical protein [Leptospirales bacterium]